MDRRSQHLLNAKDERLWMTEARHDQLNLHASAEELRAHGDAIRADFIEHESNIAGSFMRQRQAILNRELRLAGKK